MYVFVYGSLKQGYWNHDYLENENTRFLGKGIIYGYKLYHISSFPGMIKSDDHSEIVHGEVYEIDDKMLKELDNLENEGTLYKRTEVDVYMFFKKINASTYIYMRKIHPDVEEVEKNNWQGPPISLKRNNIK